MARLGVQIEVTEESTKQREFGNVPNGNYRLEVSASDVIETGSEGDPNHKQMVKLVIDVIEPEEFKGRKIFENFNVVHPNSDTQEWAKRDFSKLLFAMNMMEAPEDTEELHFIPFMAYVGMGKDSKEKNADGTPKYPASNTIKKYYYPAEGDVPEPGVDATAPKPAAAAPVSRAQAPANDNRRTAAPAAAAGGAKKSPWAKS